MHIPIFSSSQRTSANGKIQEQGSQGEPLFLEVSTTLKAMSKPNIVCIGGRYGLGSKEFTPNMVLSVYETLKKAERSGLIFAPT